MSASRLAGIPRVGDRLRRFRSRPRAFLEWQALRRWGKLPSWESQVAGYLLRAARVAAGLTQRELAQRLAVTQQAVGQAERWSANPSVAFMVRWVEACGGTLEISIAVSEPSATNGAACPSSG